MLSAPAVLSPLRDLAARVRPWATTMADERSIVLTLAVGAALTHALNMFNSPSWVAASQEGTTIYRAWALLQGRELWGDLVTRAPATTLLLGGWLGAAGGPQGFGTAFDGGRVLMLLLHVATVPLLFRLTRLLGCGVAAAALATALFAFSPLMIAQQRLVVADNYVSFWALLGAYLLLAPLPNPPPPGGRGWLGNRPLRGESRWLESPALQGQRAWWLRRLAGAACVGLALLSFDPSGASPTGAPFEILVTIVSEPFLALGAAAIVANLALGRHDARALLVGLAGGISLARLAIGGALASPMFELAIPFSLNIAVAVTPALERMPAALATPILSAAAALFIVQYATTAAFQPLYLQRPTTPEREAVAWTRAHVPPQSAIAADAWAWPELHEGRPDGALPGGLLRTLADPATAEYRLVASDAASTLGGRASPPGLPADTESAGLVKRWTTDGAQVELWKTPRMGATEPALLAGSAAYLERRFERGGAFTALDGTVSSESQASALLRAVWSGDRAAFLGTWDWTRDHLLDGDGLLASVARNGGVLSADTDAGADADAALALLMASRHWSDDDLGTAGRRMVDAIWQRDVVLVDGRPYPAAGDWALGGPIIAFSPGAFAPYAYEIFAEADPDHDWRGLIDSGYRVLAAASIPDPADNPAGLPPDWTGVDAATGELATFPGAGEEATRYGDAAAAYWRVALHFRWSGDPRAASYLQGAGFLRAEVERRGAPAGRYGRDGTVLDSRPGGAGIAGALAALLTLDPTAAHGLYAGQIVGGANRLGSGVYWGDLNDLQDQEWTWRATVLYADRLPNLWRGTGAQVAEPTQ
jgi:endo-1,4-beta-D-glucanase Y